MGDKLLIVAWDGLDHELIQRYDVDNVMLDNFGKIDNDSMMKKRSTSELYTSFITGTNYKIHGVTGINKFNARGKVLETVMPPKIRGGLPVTSIIYQKLWDLIGADKRKYEKKDLKTNTLFDVINDSKALNVPGYNPGFGWSANLKSHTLDELMYRDNPMKEAEKTVEMLFEKRWKRFQQVFDSGFNVVMSHFHYPDYIQHFHGTKDINFDEDKMRELYEEVDKYSERVKEYADMYGYDLLFMSDHGLPQGYEHNKNAFYSHNIEGEFVGDRPGITDFYTPIMDNYG
jgi:predicted AlkP superfamily phosphohydrolase/phosphomutase